MKNNLDLFISKVLDKDQTKNAERYTKELRTAAAAAGWPPIAATQLSIIVEDGGYKVYYPRDIAIEVETLEYGTASIPPSPVIRNYMKTIPKDRGMVIS